MGKIKKVWKENRVLLILGIILLLCVIVMTVVSLTYFYGSSETVYGDRLNEIEDLALNKNLFNDIKSKLKENENVEEVTTKQKGKIVYITISFADGTKMDKAKEVSKEVIQLFSEEELKVYDIQFTIKSDSTDKVPGYTLMGARNANGNEDIIWNNYNIKNDKEVED